MSDGDKKKVRVRPRRAGAAKARKRVKPEAKKQQKKAGAVKARQRIKPQIKKQKNRDAEAAKAVDAGKRPEKVVRLAGERVSEQTSLAVKEVKSAPEADKLRRAVEVIKADPVMSIEAKQKVFARFLRQYAVLFDLDNCPDDYQSLKLEAKFLAGMSGHTFVVLAQRLTRIRDLKLYEEDSYPSFRAFVDAELDLARTTVYQYMELLAVFGERALAADTNVEYTKLVPAVSLLKADHPAIPKDRIKREFLKDARVKTREEIAKKARKLKSRYGVGSEEKQQEENRLAKIIGWFLGKIPREPTEKERKEIIALIAALEEIVSPPTYRNQSGSGDLKAALSR